MKRKYPFNVSPRENILGLILAITIVIFCLHIRTEKLLTQPLNNIVAVKAEMQNGEVYELNRTEVNAFYNIVGNSKTNILLKPKHGESIQHDPLFCVEVAYMNNENDFLYLSHGKDALIRFLDIDSSGDRGYVHAVNREIYTFVNGLTTNQ